MRCVSISWPKDGKCTLRSSPTCSQTTSGTKFQWPSAHPMSLFMWIATGTYNIVEHTCSRQYLLLNYTLIRLSFMYMEISLRIVPHSKHCDWMVYLILRLTVIEFELSLFLCRIYERVVAVPLMDIPEDASFWIGQRNSAHGLFKVFLSHLC